jgi:DtxR family manganese transport transcriptional regulator
MPRPHVSRGSPRRSGAAGTSSREGFRRTRRDHAVEIAEDYVELLAHLIDERGEARLVDMARRLGVSSVTVKQTIARLQREGYVDQQPYRSVFLTAKGRAVARRCRKRHEIVLQFLTSIGVPPAQARVDAEGIEHHISPATLARLRAFLSERGA